MAKRLIAFLLVAALVLSIACAENLFPDLKTVSGLYCVPSMEAVLSREADSVTPLPGGRSEHAYSGVTTTDYRAYGIRLAAAGYTCAEAGVRDNELTAKAVMGTDEIIVCYKPYALTMRVTYPENAQIESADSESAAETLRTQTALPALENFEFDYTAPTLYAAAGIQPLSETILSDGRVMQTYTGVSENGYNLFGEHLCANGYTLTDIKTGTGFIMTRVILGNTDVSLFYQPNTGYAEIIYPAGTALETAQTAAAAHVNDREVSAEDTGKQAGDIVAFGRFEQDGDKADGREPLEWIILETDGAKALLLSLYIPDTAVYGSAKAETTWETSLLREYLNNDFYLNSFTADEQALILNTVSPAERGKAYPTSNAGRDTEDSIFILSEQETEKYLDSLSAYTTAYAATRGVQTDASAHGWWWLRNPGRDSSAALAVSATDTIYSVPAGSPFVGYRPAMWVDCTALEMLPSQPDEPLPEPAPAVMIGENVFFGCYHGDPIEWRVLTEQDGKVLLLSVYGLDSKAYNRSGRPSCWENSSLREWLNTEFIRAAFSQVEQNELRGSEDAVFLLTTEEAESYVTKDLMLCHATGYARANGAYIAADNACRWWLSSRGFDCEHTATVATTCRVGNSPVDNDSITVRPAIWIDANCEYITK